MTINSAGTTTVSASGSSGTSASFTVQPNDASTSVSTASASPTSLEIGQTSTVTITLADAYSNKLSGHAVAASSDQAGDTITYNAATTNSLGIIYAYVTSSTPHTSTLTIIDTTDAVTLASHPQITFTAPAIANPTNFAVSAGDAQVSLSWTNPSQATFDHINIYRSTTSGELGVLAATSTGTSLTDTGLTNGVTYFYILKSVDSFSNLSSGTGQLAATPQEENPQDEEAPSAPTNLRASKLAATSMTIAWDASSDNIAVTGYQVYNADTSILVGTTTNTSYSLSNLTPETTYRFYVRAYDAAGNYSANSGTLVITTLEAQTEEEIALAEQGGLVAYLVMGGVPKEVNAGNPLPGNVRVTAADNGGNIVKGYLKAVYFTSTDSAAKLTYTKDNPYTFTAQDAGTHEFAGSHFTFLTPGSQELTVSDYTTESTLAVTVKSPTFLPQVVQKVTTKVRDYLADPENSSKVNTAVATTTALVLMTPTVVNIAIGFSNILPQFLYFASQVFQLFGLRKRRKPWGVVFNSQTGQPVSLAIVRIYDPQYNRLLEQVVTDSQGRYGFLVKAGTFSLDVIKTGFTFPSKEKKPGFYEKIYLKGKFKIASSGQTIAFNIPLDPRVREQSFNLFLFFIRFNKYLQKIRWPLLILGVIFALVMIIVHLSFIYVLSLVFYLLLGLLEYLRTRRARPYGIVSDIYGHPLSLAIVRIYEKKTNRLLETDVTDSEGRFKFLINPGLYYMTAAKPGYLDFKSHIMYLQKEKTLVSTTIKLRKIREGETGK